MMHPIHQWLKDNFDRVTAVGLPDASEHVRYAPKHGNIPPCPGEPRRGRWLYGPTVRIISLAIAALLLIGTLAWAIY